MADAARRGRRTRRTRALAGGAVTVGALLLLGGLAPWIAGPGDVAPIPFPPDEIRLGAALEPPSATHWLGTDRLGRDLASRLVHGARVSMAVGLLSALLALAIGVPLGAAAGYFGGWVDAGVARLVEALLCFPSLLLALALVAGGGDRWRGIDPTLRIAFILALTGWIPIARYLRAEFLRLAASEMATAARAAGVPPLRLVVRHLLPGALAPVLVTAAFAVGAAIGVESALSYLGLGVPPPTPSWGGLLAEAGNHLREAWWLALFPGLCLFLAIQGCNLLGDGLRDALDPRRRDG